MNSSLKPRATRAAAAAAARSTVGPHPQLPARSAAMAEAQGMDQGMDWEQSVRSLVQQDVEARRAEYLFQAPRPIRGALLRLLRDPRDEPLMHLLFNVVLLAATPAACLFAFGVRSHLVGLAYLLVNYALFLQRFMLTLHFSEHRKLFRSGERGQRAGGGAPLLVQLHPQQQLLLLHAGLGVRTSHADPATTTTTTLPVATRAAPCPPLRRPGAAEPGHAPPAVYAVRHPHRPLPPAPLHHAPRGARPACWNPRRLAPSCLQRTSCSAAP